MEIKFIELDINWPNETTIFKLRHLIVSELKCYGSPIRWAITSLDTKIPCEELRKLRVEAVVLISSDCNLKS